MALHTSESTSALADVRCASCGQFRSGDEIDGNFCIDCREDAAGAEGLASKFFGDTTTPAVLVRHLHALAVDLESELPFTPLGFAVLSAKVLAALAIAMPGLDVARVSQDLADHAAHADDNAGELGALIRAELAAFQSLRVETTPPVRPFAKAAGS